MASTAEQFCYHRQPPGTLHAVSAVAKSHPLMIFRQLQREETKLKRPPGSARQARTSAESGSLEGKGALSSPLSSYFVPVHLGSIFFALELWAGRRDPRKGTCKIFSRGLLHPCGRLSRIVTLPMRLQSRQGLVPCLGNVLKFFGDANRQDARPGLLRAVPRPAPERTSLILRGLGQNETMEVLVGNMDESFFL